MYRIWASFWPALHVLGPWQIQDKVPEILGVIDHAMAAANSSEKRGSVLLGSEKRDSALAVGAAPPGSQIWEPISDLVFTPKS
jgi:hypothetical protein